MNDDQTRRGLTRRDALFAGGAAAFGIAGYIAADTTASPSAPPPQRGTAIDPAGTHQAGIARPPTPQAHALIAVLTLDDARALTAADLAARLAEVGTVIRELAGTDSPTSTAPEGAGDLTITIGLGPALVSIADATLPGAESLPVFDGDDAMAPERVGGDILVCLYASEPGVLAPALARVVAAWRTARVQWEQPGFRSPGEDTVARNPLGFLDGIIVPRGQAELDTHVWIPSGPAAGGTICVVRQLRLDVGDFTTQSTEAQERIVGRRRSDGAPLTGGDTHDEVDLRAKTPDGELITPLRSHVRAAHPSFTGSNLMLRRGYAYANGSTGGVADSGLLFICFQRELDDFVRTQRRLDESDDLMDYATPVSSGSFLVLPGFSAERPLGSSLVP